MRNGSASPPADLRRLDASKLEIGDIVLTSDNSLISRTIRTFTASDISHAMVYVQSHSIIDANQEGVHARNTQRLWFPADCALYVLRSVEQLTSHEVMAICAYARSQVGTQYAVAEAVQSVSPLRAAPSRKQFCSRLAAQAYAAAGIVLTDTPDYASPDDLLRSPRLVRVADVTETVSPEEAAAWRMNLDGTQLMRRVTNRVFDGIRALDPTIQTFDDIDQFLIANPHHDALVADIFQRSGYLSAWALDRMKNPWRYDIVQMTVMGEAHAEDVDADCLRALRDPLTRIDHWATNLEGYSRLYAAYGLTVFALKRDLYQHLVNQDQLRQDTARTWLARPARTARLFAGKVPHTPEWFEALEARNPKQAAITRMVVDKAARLDVCSICGDDPAADMALVEEEIEAAGRLTLKLCEDCRAIRAADGEIFEALP